MQRQSAVLKEIQEIESMTPSKPEELLSKCEQELDSLNIKMASDPAFKELVVRK